MKNAKPNEIINEGKEIVQSIQNKGYQKENMVLYEWLSYVGIRMYYDTKYKELIQKVFLESNFYHTKEDLQKFLFDEFYLTPDVFSGDTLARGVSLKTFYRDKEITKIESNVFITSYGSTTRYQVLEAYIHEINHILNSFYNSVIKKEVIYSRVGLELAREDGRSIGSGLEEAFNTLQTESILNCLDNLSIRNIKEKEFLNFYQKVFNTRKEKQLHSYEKLTSFLRPFYENPKLYKLMEEKRLLGEIEKLKSEFDFLMGNGTYNFVESELDYYLYKEQEESKKKIKK